MDSWRTNLCILHERVKHALLPTRRRDALWPRIIPPLSLRIYGWPRSSRQEANEELRGRQKTRVQRRWKRCRGRPHRAQQSCHLKAAQVPLEAALPGDSELCGPNSIWACPGGQNSALHHRRWDCNLPRHQRTATRDVSQCHPPPQQACVLGFGHGLCHAFTAATRRPGEGR